MANMRTMLHQISQPHLVSYQSVDELFDDDVHSSRDDGDDGRDEMK